MPLHNGLGDFITPVLGGEPTTTLHYVKRKVGAGTRRTLTEPTPRVCTAGQAGAYPP